MSGAVQNRISVVRDNELVPLLPSHGEGREQPWGGVLLERHKVSAIEIPEHTHREMCLHLQVSGQDAMEWWSGGRHGVEKTAPGSMILLPAGTEDRLRWHGESERLILTLRPELLERIAEESSGVAPEFEARWSLKDAGLRRLLAEMGREASEGWPLGRLYADLTAVGLVNQLLRRHAAHPVDPGLQKGGLPMPQLRHAMEFISANLDRNLSLEEIAREVRLSQFHFVREFRAVTCQTPYQYLLDQRMERARQLLRNRSWTVQEIASMTGFSSPANFVRTFRQRVGVTPGAWRESV
jgi:AraC family transcriptional regulator